MTAALEPEALLRALWEARVEYVLIGGLAVNAYGVIRATKDVDICPSPDPANLRRLGALLARVSARQLGVDEEGGFEAHEMPFDPRNADDLKQGGNFRLATDVGVLDVMQWVPGVDAEQAYDELAKSAITADPFGISVRVCALGDLLRMKRAAGRPQDLEDIASLRLAHPDA